MCACVLCPRPWCELASYRGCKPKHPGTADLAVPLPGPRPAAHPRPGGHLLTHSHCGKLSAPQRRSLLPGHTRPHFPAAPAVGDPMLLSGQWDGGGSDWQAFTRHLPIRVPLPHPQWVPRARGGRATKGRAWSPEETTAGCRRERPRWCGGQEKTVAVLCHSAGGSRLQRLLRPGLAASAAAGITPAQEFKASLGRTARALAKQNQATPREERREPRSNRSPAQGRTPAAS